MSSCLTVCTDLGQFFRRHGYIAFKQIGHAAALPEQFLLFPFENAYFFLAVGSDAVILTYGNVFFHNFEADFLSDLLLHQINLYDIIAYHYGHLSALHKMLQAGLKKEDTISV